MYLLDTNTCIFFMRGRFRLGEKVGTVGFENCCVSEITIAELKYGVENIEQVEENRQYISAFH